MRRILLVVLCFAVFPLLAANPAAINLDFETGSPGEVPPGWFAPTTHLGYDTALVTDSPKEGRQCVRVSGKPLPEAGKPSFGNVMQTVDATPYRGKRVRLRGAVRVEGSNAIAGLWMRVDRPEMRPGFFDSMRDRPIRAAQWTYYDVEGDIADDAEWLNFGMILREEGSAWLDDVSLEITASDPTRAVAAHATSSRAIENLIAFTRLYGVVRYFHPSDEAVAADWTSVAVNGAEFVESAKDANELAQRLTEVFAPLAPSLQVSSSSTMNIAAIEPGDATTIVSWEHYGVTTGDTGKTMYHSDRVRRAVTDKDTRSPDPRQPRRIDLGGGVFASIPFAVFANGRHTLPVATRKPLPFPSTTYSGNDRGTRIGAVVILWNVIQHFYPYFDLTDVDWPAELKTALQSAATDADEMAFLRTLKRMMAAIDDGHGNAYFASGARRPRLPVVWRVIDNELIVTAVADDVTNIKVGDEVVQIDGMPALSALRDAEALVSAATPQWRRFIASSELAANGPVQTVLTIRNADGTTRNVTIKRTQLSEPLTEKRPDTIAQLKPRIWYVDLTRATQEEVERSMQRLATAKGIIFDLRGYPSDLRSSLLQHMIGGVARSAYWNVPVARYPDRENVEWSAAERWRLEPTKPRFTKNIVFLTDARAISYAESWMGIIEAYKIGTIVGETTAGTNGNINIIPLPGGYRAVFTGMKVLKHDGTRHHGVGIAPDIKVSPTRAGVREGRDEQLEAAMKVVTK